MIPTQFYSWFGYVNRLLHSDAAKPDHTAYRICLSLADDLHPGMSAVDVFSRELPFNYGRISAQWAGLGTVDPFLNAHVLPEVVFSVAAADRDLFFRSLIMVADVASEQTAILVTGVNTVTGNITTAGAHAFSSGDRTLLLTDGERPVNVPQQFYYVQRLSPTVVRLQNEAGADVIPLTPGSGNLRLAYVQEPAKPYFFQTFDQVIQIPSQASKAYRLLSRVRGL